MTSEDHIRNIVEPAGSMDRMAIAEELESRFGYDKREAKAAVVDALESGLLDEHPRFKQSYIISED